MGRLSPFKALRSDRGGAAAAEMAMVVPLLLVLLFGSFEMGRYFLDEHVVLKAVRDGARYASRQTFSNYTCPSTVNPIVLTNTQNIVRYGKPVVVQGDQLRLPYWTATIPDGSQSVKVTLTCPSRLVGTETLSGLYPVGGATVPVVTVQATVPYNSLFGSLGMGSGMFYLTAESQATVMGV